MHGLALHGPAQHGLLGPVDGCGLLGSDGLFLLCNFVMGSGELLLESPVLLDDLGMGLLHMGLLHMGLFPGSADSCGLLDTGLFLGPVDGHGLHGSGDLFLLPDCSGKLLLEGPVLLNDLGMGLLGTRGPCDACAS